MLAKSSIQWGDFPTWVASIGTVGTLVWAMALFASDRRGRRQGEERAQASQVAAWVDRSSWNYPHDAAPTGECDVVVRNASELPVTDVVVALLTWAWYDKRSLERQASRLFPAVAPGGTTNSVSFDSEVPPAGRIRAERFNPPILLEFFDAHHRRWRRLPDGVLERI